MDGWMDRWMDPIDRSIDLNGLTKDESIVHDINDNVLKERMIDLDGCKKATRYTQILVYRSQTPL